MENLLIRSQPCPECGAEMLWSQNAWKTGDTGAAAYRCEQGHLIDPALTRQCPACGVHDTVRLGESDGREQFKCSRCQEAFTFPH
jgi:ssDNA-binding Zn-finger/Zn-ribbon topoisomerase 1